MLRPSDAVVRAYYRTLDDYAAVGAAHEGAVRTAFHDVLAHAARGNGWTLVPEHSMRAGGARIRLDGALRDGFGLTHGLWEAKDTADDLPAEVQRKAQKGYPLDNIVFQAPRRALLYQHRTLVFDADLTDPQALCDVVEALVGYEAPALDQFHEAVAAFKDRLPELGAGLLARIREAETADPAFRRAFEGFHGLCRASINPNLSKAAVEEMLIQHLLTERIFRTVFDDRPSSRASNVIAAEIENGGRRPHGPELQPQGVPAARSTASTRPSRTPPAPSRTSPRSRIPQHRLRAVLPGLLGAAPPTPTASSTRRSRSWTSWSRAWTRSSARQFGLRLGDDGRPRPRPVHGHRQLPRAGHAGDARAPAPAEVRRRRAAGRTARQRGDAAALLRGEPERRARIPRPARATTRPSPASASSTRSNSPRAQTISMFTAAEHRARRTSSTAAPLTSSSATRPTTRPGQRERQQPEPQVPDHRPAGRATPTRRLIEGRQQERTRPIPT